MTLVEFIGESTQQVTERMNFDRDDTLARLLFWVEKALAGRKEFAQFVYNGSFYIVTSDE